MRKCIFLLCFFCVPLAVFCQIADITCRTRDYTKFSLERPKMAGAPTSIFSSMVEQFTIEKTKKQKIVPSACFRLLSQDRATLRASCKAEISSKKWDREVKFNVSWSY
jgi:hypothetical protein